MVAVNYMTSSYMFDQIDTHILQNLNNMKQTFYVQSIGTYLISPIVFVNIAVQENMFP